MKRTNCGACGYDDLQLILDLGLSPIADAYTATADESVSMHPLQLAVCTGCWLVQLLEVVDQETLFGTGYSFYSSASDPLSAYHREYAQRILKNREAYTPFVVEIGCNDGDMLQHFQAANCQVLGVDPAVGPATYAAEKRHLPVCVQPFTLELAREIHAQHGHAQIIIANHVLAHVEDVSVVMSGISELLDARDGTAYVEVQYLPDLLLNNAFDLVYHEHRNFFTLTSLESAARRWNLHVVDAQLTNRQGGSLRVALRRQRDTSLYVESLRASESWLPHVGAYAGLQGRAERIRQRLLDMLHGLKDVGWQLAGYGAPAKATTLLNFCGVTSDLFEWVVDTTEAKQNRFIPGTGIQILKVQDVEDVDVYLLLAWNYAADIMRKEEYYRGRWIVPIPVPTLL